MNPKSWLFDVFLVAATSGTTPTRAGGGGAGGPLAPCPPTPNCVSSLPGESPARRVAPIRYALPLDEAVAAVRRVLARLPRTRIVRVRHDYLHAEFTSRVFRFVDDVEFYFDEAHKCLHVRSASRVGYWDFGVNRRRVEALRVRLAPVLAPPPAATQDAGLRP